MILFLLVVLASVSVNAVSIGVSRADLGFSDVLRGGYAEDTFVVSTDSPVLIGGAVEVEGDIVDWVRFEPEGAMEGFGFSVNQPQQVTVIVEPPIDAANGDYEGSIRVITGEVLRDSDGQFGTSTRAAFKIDVIIGVTDVELLSCVLGGVTMRTTEIQQPIDLQYSIQNSGNVRVRPEIEVTVYDQLQERVVAVSTVEPPGETLPTTTERFISQLTNTLEPGQYWARVASEQCTGGGFTTFDVLERGGVADTGEFLRIDMDSFVNTGDIVPITAVFQNTGSRTVSAKFKGSILQGNRLVKIIDTDFYDTPPGAIANIETFFNPDAPGKYEVKGRVLYNNKLTYERIGILNVGGSALSQLPVLPFLMVVIILVLLLLIRRKRRHW